MTKAAKLGAKSWSRTPPMEKASAVDWNQLMFILFLDPGLLTSIDKTPLATAVILERRGEDGTEDGSDEGNREEQVLITSSEGEETIGIEFWTLVLADKVWEGYEGTDDTIVVAEHEGRASKDDHGIDASEVQGASR